MGPVAIVRLQEYPERFFEHGLLLFRCQHEVEIHQQIDLIGYLAQVRARLLAGETDYNALTPYAIAQDSVTYEQ